MKAHIGILYPLSLTISQLKEHCLHNLPDLHAGSNASGASGISPATGHMHVEHRFILLIAENGSSACYFVSGLQDRMHWIYRSYLAVFRPDNEPAVTIRSTQNNQGGRSHAFVPGKALNGLMDYLSVFQSQDKDSALLDLFRFHD